MRMLLVLTAAALLAGCSSNEIDPTGGEAAEVAADAPADAKAHGADALKVALPQLAYRYSLTFLVPEARLAQVQDGHRALCERMGPARCQLVTLSRTGEDDRAGDALLRLRVAAADASGFTGEAEQQINSEGGRSTGTRVVGEDVSKDLSDTAARIRQRELLVARLTETLRTRKGSVGELVEAERSVAAAQEELDKARAWLKELRGRVAMADIEIRYRPLAAPASGNSVVAALGEAIAGSAATFVWGVQALMSLAIYLLPWAALFGSGAAIVTLLRRKRSAT
ncbi:DUF4349 domain-containing protein [Sphingomonas sp. RS6]